MDTRIRHALESRRFFKLICGASYRNRDFVAQLSELFALAGAHVIDIGADPELVAAVQQGIKKAQQRNPELQAPLIMISVGINEDVHFLKVSKEYNRCENHGYCANACPHGVFVGDSLRLENCLGCDHCVIACPEDALTLVPREPLDSVEQLVRQCFAAGASAIEVHTGHGGREALNAVFDVLLPFQPEIKLLACSLGAHGQSIEALVELAHHITTLWSDEMIIQADGQPISGRKGWRSTWPALVLAQHFFEAKVPAFIQVSGGVNDLTREIACREGIPIHGVGTGSFARKYLGLSPHVPLTSETFEVALAKASALVQSANSARFPSKPAKMIEHKQQ
jgi:Fe-S-cluster-containing hydrogenase component 2